jgi:predicted phage terminase large subunit-like protein
VPATSEVNRILAARKKARTDIIWLAKHVLGYKDVDPEVHFPVINSLQKFDELQGKDEFLPPGAFKYTPKEGNPEEILSGTRRRLILDPRGFLKTTLNVITHSIQWILNYPNVAILIVHASGEKAEEVLQEIKAHFQSNPAFRYFFPEYCPRGSRGDWGTRQYFTTPARNQIRKEPTVSVGAIEKAMAGSHYHVIKFTDVVDLSNVGTKAQLDKVIYTFGMFRNLLISPRHWIDVEGTRYDFHDLYGRIIDNRFKDSQWQIMVRGVYKKDIPDPKFTPEELDAPYLLDAQGRRISWWPKRFPTEELERERTDPTTGEYVFASQKLNNPVDLSEEKPFPLNKLTWIEEEALKRVPMSYYTTTVDTADTVGEKSNYSCLTTCGWDRMGRCYVVDIRLGKFLPDEIVSQMFNIQQKYKPRCIRVEETAFVRGLWPSVGRMRDLSGIFPVFDFIKRDNVTAKQERILSIQPWYKAGEIRFSAGLPEFVKERLVQELSRFPKTTHDDILDTLADQFQNRTFFGPEKPRPRTPEEKDTFFQKEMRKFLGMETPEEMKEGRYQKYSACPDFYNRTGGL